MIKREERVPPVQILSMIKRLGSEANLTMIYRSHRTMHLLDNYFIRKESYSQEYRDGEDNTIARIAPSIMETIQTLRLNTKGEID